MKTSFRAKALACALLATTAFCGLTAQPALAATPTAAPPVRQSIDPNGVDMALGTFNVSSPDLSIGPDGPMGLVYSRELRGAGWRDSLTATLNRDASGRVVVSIAGSSDSFMSGASGYIGTEGNGATLTFNGSLYTYTSSDGTVATFTPADGRYDRFEANEGWARNVTFPNGVKWTYQYYARNYCPQDLNDEFRTCTVTQARSVRLQSVTNNAGYQLKLSYVSNTLTDIEDLAAWNQVASVKGINNAEEYCNPIADSCTLAGTWPMATYGRSGSHDTVTNAAGEETRYTLDSSGRVTGIKRESATSDDVVVSYGAGDRVTRITRAGTTFDYGWVDDGNLRTMTMTGPLLAKVVAVSEIDTSRVRSVTDALGRTTSYDYTGNRLSKVTMPEGNEVRYAHDTRGNVVETRFRDKAGNIASDIVTSAGFDGACANPKICNKPVTTTDARGATTEYTYDGGHGGVRTVTAPAPTPGAVRPQTRIDYLPFQARYQNSPGNIVASGSNIILPVAVSACKTQASCAGSADEARTTVSYEPENGGGANNLLPVSTSSGDGTATPKATSVMTYDTIGNLLTVDGPLDGTADTSRIRYDAMRRPVGSVSADPDGSGPLKHRASRVARNSDGQVSKVESGTVESQSDADWNGFTPIEAAETGYDDHGRPTVQKLTAGGATYALTQTNYDALGRPNCVAQRMNRGAFVAIASTTGACAVGERATGTDDLGPDRISQTFYDELGRVKEAWSAVGTADQAAEARYSYTPNGQMETLTDGEGNRTTSVYDGHDRLWLTQFPVAAKGANLSNPGDFEALGYDAAGNLTSRRVRDEEVIRYEYDALNRLTYKNLPNTAVYENDSGFGYDLLGRMVTAGDGMGHQMSFGYDSLGRRVSESSNWYGTTSSAYDLAGRRTLLRWRDGFFVTYEHLVTGEMTAVRENGGFVLASFGYDERGNRTKLTRGNGTVTDYTPDAVSRLEMLKQTFAAASAPNTLTLGFTYNPAGQIASNTRSNDLFAWTGSAAGTTGFEVNGRNQIDKQNGVQFSYDLKGNLLSDGTRSYSYTAENRLASGASTDIYYDALGRLVHLTSGINFHYHGGEFIETQSASGATRRYVHGPGIDEPLVWYEGAGNTDRRYLHADERGSIVAVSDGSGNVIGINKYDEYGMPAATNIGSFGYTGQVWLPELGLWHYKARMYDPRLGRFLQPDPIGYGDGMNMYAYVQNDPINYSDPEGDRSVTPGERRMLNKVFGNQLQPVDIYPIPGLTSSITFPTEIDFKYSDYAADFSSGASIQQKRIFWHEFYHVFEIQKGIVSWGALAWNVVSTLHADSSYVYDNNKPFMQNNPEARAAYFAGCMTGGGCSAMNGFKFSPNSQTTIAFKNGVFTVRTTQTGSLAPRTTTVRAPAGKPGEKVETGKAGGKTKKK